MVSSQLSIRSILSLGQTCHDLLAFSDYRNLRARVLPVPPSTVGDSELVKVAVQLEEETLKVLRTRNRAPQIKEFHLIPFPEDPQSAGHDLDPEACTVALSLMTRMRELRCLRLDLDLAQLPPAYLQHFPKLTELQLTSTCDLSSLTRLLITKLTIVQRRGRTGLTTVQNLAHLTHLNLVLSDEPKDPLLDFDSLPSLRCLCVSHAQDGHALAFEADGTPSSLEIMSLHRVKPAASFLDACQSLQHLHLVMPGADLPPLRLGKLKVLEIVHGAITPPTLRNSRLPALTCYLECAPVDSLGDRIQNPLGVLGDQIQKLEIVVLNYADLLLGRNPDKVLDPENNRLPETMDTLYERSALKRGYVCTSYSGPSSCPPDEQHKWGFCRQGNNRFPWPGLVSFLQVTDANKVFIQTRVCEYVQGLRDQERDQEGHIPLEHLYFNDAYSQCSEYTWARRLDWTIRLSFLDQFKLLSPGRR
ncbi:MAG: hypothetical protein Q9198_008293 [Flavoplaca austrocitrina]